MILFQRSFWSVESTAWIEHFFFLNMKNQTFYENWYSFPNLLPKELTTYQTTALDLLAALLVVIRDQIYIQILGEKNNNTTACHTHLPL